MADDQWGGLTGVRKYFYFIKDNVSSGWKDLGFHLGFKRADRENVAGRNKDDKSCCLDLLEEWHERNGEKATIKVLMEALSEANLQSTVDGLKGKYPELSCRDPWPVLPVHLQLSLDQTTGVQQPARVGQEHINVRVVERILELERTLFTVEVLHDPVRYRKACRIFKKHKALLMAAVSGSIILLLTFLRQTDVDRFYHNHHRVGEGTLSQQLSHILISDELRDKVKGTQLIVRLQVKHEDYVRVRDRLGQWLGRTTSVDNLLALPPPSRQVSRSSLSGLDLAVVSGEDQLRLCTDRTDDVSTLNFTAREVQSGIRTATVRTAREKSQQMEVRLQTLRVQLETARQDAEAMRREVARMKQREETTQTVLSEHKEEIRTKELRIEAMREDIKTAREQTEATVFDSVTKEIARLKEEKEEAEKTLQEQREEIQKPQESNNNMAARMEELTAENTKMSNQLAEVPDLREEVRKWREKDEESQKLLSEQKLKIRQSKVTLVEKLWRSARDSLRFKIRSDTGRLSEGAQPMTPLMPDLSQLYYIADNAGRSWKDLARRLGFSEADIEVFEDKHPTDPRECCMDMLTTWQRRTGKQGTTGVLKEALEKVGRMDIAVNMDFYKGLPGEARGTHEEMERLTRGAESTSSLPDNLQLNYITDNVGLKWKDLARMLGFSERDIEVFEDKHRDLRECCMDMLTFWQRRTGNEGTTGVLKEALEVAGLKEIADNFEFRFDAFVVHSSEDSVWVHELVQQLESPPHNLRICIDDRDFMPARPVFDNIIWAIDNSRKTLVVLSQNFLSSEWCEYELKVAIMKERSSDKNCVVPILRSECEIPHELAHLTYLDCTDGTVDVATLASNIRSNLEKKVTTV